jgi:prevent-host-death family protein
MATIRPISDLRNKANQISRLCHQSGEPVFITKNGEGDLVVMSLAAYERDRARLELYRLLDEEERDVRGGDRGVSVRTMRRRLARP